MYRLRLISPEAVLLLSAMALGSCQKSRADLSSEQVQKRADYGVKTAQLDQQEAAQKAAVHRQVFEKKMQAWQDVAESQVKANSAVSPDWQRNEARELSNIRATKRLELLDARVSELRVRLGGVPAGTRSALGQALEDLRPLRADAVHAVTNLREETVPLDQAQNESDQRLGAFEAAIDSVTRKEHAALVPQT